MSEPIKAAIYTRVSSQEQASADKTSLDLQREKAEGYCNVHDWDVVQVYEDAGVSGAEEHRPALDAMLADAEAGKFQRVVFLKLDRLGRKARLLLDISEKLDVSGVAIVSVFDSFDTGTPSGRLYFTILGAVAEFERDLIAERTMMGKLGNAKTGNYVAGGTPPYGYDWHPDKDIKKLVINEVEAAVVRRIYTRMYVEEGLPQDRIAERLNAEHIPTKTTRVRSQDGEKKGWVRTQVARVLTNPLYKGTTHYGKTVGDGNARKARPEEEWIEVAVPPIVSEEEWAAAQRRAKRNKRESQRPRDKASKYLLSGLIRCQSCGRAMATHTNRIRQGERRYAYRYYFCTGQHNYGDRCRQSERVRADKVEEKVMELITNTFSRPEVVLEGCEAYTERLQAAEEEQDGVVAALRRHMEKANTERQRYIELYAKEMITEAELNKHLAKLAADVATWQEDLSRQEEAGQQKAVVREIEASAYAIAETIKPTLEAMTLEERKEIVRLLVTRVWLDAGNEITVECVVPGLISDRRTVATTAF